MTHIDIHQIEGDLPHYLEQVEQGETIVVTRDDVPIAELRPVAGSRRTPWPLGLGRGLGEIHPGFFKPLPEDLLSFYGEES